MNVPINDTAWYIAVAMACGLIAFYSLPEVVPFLVRRATMLMVQASVGLTLRCEETELNDGP